MSDRYVGTHTPVYPHKRGADCDPAPLPPFVYQFHRDQQTSGKNKAVCEKVIEWLVFKATNVMSNNNRQKC